MQFNKLSKFQEICTRGHEYENLKNPVLQQKTRAIKNIYNTLEISAIKIPAIAADKKR